MASYLAPVESATHFTVPKILTLSETAEILRKSPAQLRWMIHQGTAPKSALIGGRRAFLATDVTAFISQAFENEN